MQPVRRITYDDKCMYQTDWISIVDVTETPRLITA